MSAENLWDDIVAEQKERIERLLWERESIDRMLEAQQEALANMILFIEQLNKEKHKN